MHPFSLGNYLGTSFIIGNSMRIMITSVDVDDVAPPIVKLSDAKCHASLLYSFLLEFSNKFSNSLYFDVNETTSFQKLVGNLDKMTVTNLGRQHQRSLNSYFKNSWKHSYLFGVISYYFIPSILLELVVYVFQLILLMFTPFAILMRRWYLDNTTFIVFPKRVIIKREKSIRNLGSVQ